MHSLLHLCAAALRRQVIRRPAIDGAAPADGAAPNALQARNPRLNGSSAGAPHITMLSSLLWHNEDYHVHIPVLVVRYLVERLCHPARCTHRTQRKHARNGKAKFRDSMRFMFTCIATQCAVHAVFSAIYKLGRLSTHEQHTCMKKAKCPLRPVLLAVLAALVAPS
eukprot:2700667-Pleurochrysis_carterae.AAC.6